MIHSNTIEERVRSDVMSTLIPTTGQARLDPDDDLLSIFDSLQILRLTVRLESTFGVKIDNSELTAANIGTLGRLTTFICAKADNHDA